MGRIFISYSRSDSQFITELVPLLKDSLPGHEIWYDAAVTGGEQWWQRILSEVHRCDVFLYLLSNESLESKWCQQELRTALQLGKQFLSVKVRRLDMEKAPRDLRPEIEKYQTLDMSLGFNDHRLFAQLIGSLNRLLGATPLPTPVIYPLQKPPITTQRRSRRGLLVLGMGLMAVVLLICGLGGLTVLRQIYGSSPALTVTATTTATATSSATPNSGSPTPTQTATATGTAGPLDSPLATATVAYTPTKYRAPVNPNPGPSFVINSVTSGANPPAYNGLCPVTIISTGYISAQGTGVGSYRWEHSFGGAGATTGFTIGASGSVTATDYWTIGSSGSYSNTLRVLTPNSVLGVATFTVNCYLPTATIVPKASSILGIKYGVNPQKYADICPAKFVFTADIGTDGPMQIYYQWERSDGTVIGPKSYLNATSAGDHYLYDTWILGKGSGDAYDGYEVIHVLSPVDMYVDKIYGAFSMYCK